MTLNDGGTIWQHPVLPYSLSDRMCDVDVSAVHEFLTSSYWSKGIPFETVRRSVEGSHCFSLFAGDNTQAGFARVISDHATIAYLGDVYVLEAHRGKGLAQWMMEHVMGHPELQGLRRLTLATRDMHALYRKSGFHSLSDVGKYMEFLPDRDYG